MNTRPLIIEAPSRVIHCRVAARGVASASNATEGEPWVRGLLRSAAATTSYN